MSSRPILLAAVLCLIPAAGLAHEKPRPAPAAALPGTADAVTAVVDAFHRAVATGNLKAAADLIADDAVIYEHGGVERTKAQYLAEHLPADAAYSRGMTETVTARASHVSGSTAWVITDGRTTGVYNGKPVDRMTTETMILGKAGGRWRIVHIHWSSGASKAGA